ncbi:hypothetical protein ACHAPO_009266 [Fusarium lateritium]
MASNYRYTDSLAGPGTTSGAAKSGRLKGKARKAAKQQKTPTVAAAKEGSDPSPKSKYVLAIRDFVPLAKFIASNLTTTPVEDNNTAGIPSFFSTALDRAIQVRKKFSSLLKDAGESLSAQADKTHEHFITILEKVRTVFLHVDGASGMESTNDSTKNANDKSGAEAKFFNFNLFETLRVYEPSEDFLNSSDAVHPAASLPIDLEYTTESDMSETECMLALTALFKDFINLREEINSLWNEYRTGKIDLAAAAVGVNLAIELARSLEEDIAPLLESHGGSTEVLPHYYGMVCESMDLDFSEKERPSDDMNFECYNVGSTFLYNAVNLLAAIQSAAPFNAKQMPCYNGKFGWYDSKAETVDNRQRWAQEKAALLEVASDIAMLTEFKGIPVIDEFARGIKHMFESREIPIWLCFAAQNYLDTLHFFGPDIKKCVAEFDRFNATTTQRLDRIIGSVESDAKKIIGNMRDMLKVKKDGYDIFTVARIAANGIDRPSSFFLHNPLFCGLWINYVRMNFHQNGVVYAAKPGALLHTVQLYTAVRQHQQEHSVPVVEWPDLDRVIDMQGYQAFFVGGEPTTSPEAHFKNYCMSRSVSPTNWLAAAKRRKGKGGKVDMAKSRAGVRELKLKSPLSRYTGSRSEKHGRVESAPKNKGQSPWPKRYMWGAEGTTYVCISRKFFDLQPKWFDYVSGVMLKDKVTNKGWELLLELFGGTVQILKGVLSVSVADVVQGAISLGDAFNEEKMRQEANLKGFLTVIGDAVDIENKARKNGKEKKTEKPNVTNILILVQHIEAGTYSPRDLGSRPREIE